MISIRVTLSINVFFELDPAHLRVITTIPVILEAVPSVIEDRSGYRTGRFHLGTLPRALKYLHKVFL